MKKNLIVKQEGYKECGASCLLSIIRYYGGNISINKLLEMTYTNKMGTNFYCLSEAAFMVGLESVAFSVESDDFSSKLQSLKLPSICQIIDNNYEHFVVVYKIKSDSVTMMDPSVGFRTVKLVDFLNVWTGFAMVFSKVKELPYIKETNYLNKVILETLFVNKKIIFGIIFLSIIFTVVSCFYTMYSGLVIDLVIGTTKNNLLVLTFVFSMLMLVKCIISFFRNELLIFLNCRLDCSIFLNAFQKILLLPYSYYKNRTTGEIISRINDLAYIKNMLSKMILTVFLDLIISLVCGVMLFWLNKVMFLLMIVTILIYVIIFYVFQGFLKKYTDMNQENNAQINSLMVESINGFETIKNLNVEGLMKKKMNNLYASAQNDSFIYDNVSNFELFIKDLVTLVIVLLVEYIGFNLVFDDILSVGEVVMFITLITYFLEPIKNIIDLNRDYFYASNSLKRANDLFDIDSVDLVDKTNYILSGNIKVNNLTYSYNGYINVLNAIDFDIKKGEKVLFLGNTGSGKSTILKIFSKYYVPNRDSVYFDNIDINDISIYNLKKNLVSISQDEIIFNDTIRNNIILDRNVSDDRFDEICKIVCVDRIVEDLFLGYDTRLEENGKNISGGQRQRIILARALLKKSNIILIDEGLNAVDIDMERIILKNIFEKFSDKTIIIVSHRLENMDLYDKVLKFKDGILEDVLVYH